MNKLNYNPTKKIGELEKEIENVKEVSRELEGSISNGYHKGSHI